MKSQIDCTWFLSSLNVKDSNQLLDQHQSNEWNFDWCRLSNSYYPVNKPNVLHSNVLSFPLDVFYHLLSKKKLFFQINVKNECRL